MEEQKKQGKQEAPKQAPSQLQVIKSETVDDVEKRIAQLQRDGAIHFPPNYSPQNALRSAWLILQETKDKNDKPVLEVCTKQSISNALLDTVIQGLSPAKKQMYYIAYGNHLTAMRSYFGTMAVTKRLEGVKSIFAQVVYEKDQFDYVISGSTKKVTKHVQKIENIDIDKIVAAYCTILSADDEEYTDIMTMKQIRTSWKRGATKGESSAHRDAPDQMAMRTVINRTCKIFANTSNDSDLLIESFNRTSGYVDEDAAEEIENNANMQVIDVTPTKVIDTPKEAPKELPKETPVTSPFTPEAQDTDKTANRQKAKSEPSIEKQGTLPGPNF